MMDTEIRFLQELEGDLLEAAERESPEAGAKVRRLEPGRRGRVPRRRRSRGKWMAVAASVVAFLTAAGVLGWMMTPHDGVEKRVAVGSAERSVGGEKHAPAPMASPTTVWEQKEFAGDDQSQRATLQQDALASGDLGYVSNAGGGGAAPATAPGGSNQGLAPNIGGAPAMGEVSKVVKTSQLSVVVPGNGFQEAFATASKVGKRYGGFVQSSSMETPRRGHMIIRVQARYFDEAMDELRALGRVESESMGGQDVTAQFIDLKARLEIVQNRKDLLVELQKQAVSADQILRYENLIEDAQLQIEQLKGRINLINDQTSKATIRLDMREAGVPAASAKHEEAVTNPNLFTAWKRAVAGFLTVVGFILVGLGYLVPVGVIVAAFWLGMRALRRARHRAILEAP